MSHNTGQESVSIFWYDPKKWLKASSLLFLTPVIALHIFTAFESTQTSGEEIAKNENTAHEALSKSSSNVLSLEISKDLQDASKQTITISANSTTIREESEAPKAIESASAQTEATPPPNALSTPPLESFLGSQATVAKEDLVKAEPQIVESQTEAVDAPLVPPSDPEICFAALHALLDWSSPSHTSERPAGTYVGLEKIKFRKYFVFLSSDGKIAYRCYIKENQIFLDYSEEFSKGLGKAKWKTLKRGLKTYFRLENENIEIVEYQKKSGERSTFFSFGDFSIN